MVNKILVLFILLVLNCQLIAQNLNKGVFLRVKNESSYIRIAYYDSSLDDSVLQVELPKTDSVFIEQSWISSIGGFSGFGDPQKQFWLLTLPGDSIEVHCNKAGDIRVRLLNKSTLHQLRQQEMDKWRSIVDDSFLKLMKEYRKKKDINKILATYEEGHAKRQMEISNMYKGYINHLFYQTKMASAAFTKENNVFLERFYMSVLDTTTINALMDSLVVKINNPLLINQPSIYNNLAGNLYKISKQNPNYYTTSHWFNYVANKVQPGPLQKQILLYYVKRCKTPQWYDSLATRFAQLYPDKETADVLAKYRKLKFLNLNSQTSCSVTNTVGNIVSFDSLVGQYKGTPIYIDFWASWCAPCLAEMPQSKKMRQLYNNKVQFIYISVDDHEEQWLGGLKRNRLQPAAHYLLPDGLFVYKGTKIPVTGVPRHILIDAEGNMVDDHAPGPGDKLLPAALNSLIK
jgi:thiol-disulfide isomerase/thioredoxin